MPEEEQRKRWGFPVEPEFYKANNQATIAGANAEAIINSGIQIYLESGDRDFFNAHDGAEFLHRVLWESHIEHEYHLLRGCDHVGASILWRIEDAHRFLR